MQMEQHKRQCNMKPTERRWRIGGLSLWMMPVALSLLLSGCGCSDKKSSCSNNNDCAGTSLCVNGKCVADTPTETDTADTSSATSSDTATDSETSSAISGTDSVTDTGPSDSESGSDIVVCTAPGLVENGLACVDNCDCASMHCNNGFCCDGGECCADAGDCTNDLCAAASCQDGACAYSTALFSCGAEDVSGQTCQDGYVCDGQGGCLPVAPSGCGLFAAADTFTCGALEAEPVCYTSCNISNADVNCVEGAICVNGSCVSFSAADNGSACELDGDCLSGHCGDGICCAAGECCVTAVDCSDECSANVQCGSNNQCFSTKLGCGIADTNGLDTCSGDSLCDGAGSCVNVTTCAEQSVLFGASGGYTCTTGAVTENCFADCTSSAQCGVGTQCVDGECLAPSGGTCTGDGDCVTGHCSNGVCCASGECCTENSDCDVPCQSGEVCNTDLYQCESGSTWADCGWQETGCTDGNRCDGAGSCVAVTDYCTGNGEDTYSCSDGQVIRDCRCNSNTDCDLDDIFCNGTYLCGVGGICRYDTPVDACPAASACYTDVTCNETTQSCAGTNPCDALATECDFKRCVDDGVGGYSCEANQAPNTTACDDGLACNGTLDYCSSGVCIGGPLSASPCYDDNACTTDVCEENDTDVNAPICTNDPIALGSSCDMDFNCYGDNATCELDESANVSCIPVEVPCTNQGVCFVHECSEDFTNDSVVCTDTPNISYVNIACGQQVVLTADDFVTRVYVDYSGPNDQDTDTDQDCQAPVDEPFIGKEAVIYIEADTATDHSAQLEIISVSPMADTDLDFMLFDGGDVCDWNTCSARQTGGFTGIPMTVGGRSPELVIDSRTEYLPPESLTLQLNCP